jgi:glycosyltransferase involved in cell wall biosynthesis
MSCLLSIIVPTKDRYKYLMPLITLVKNLNTNEIELVIQDNSYDNLEILDFIKSISYVQLKYFHHKEKLSTVQNFDKAVLNSTGEYVCFIGDDDGVTRNILNCVKWMKKCKIEALRSRKQFLYSWPDKIYIPGVKRAGVLIYESHKETYELKQPIEELNKVCKIGMQNIGLMPKLYHGIVRRDILDHIYKIGGTYFPGAAADMANAVALCFFVQKLAVVNFPVTIYGSSKMFGGGLHRKKNRLAKLSEVDFLSNEVRSNWEKRIPALWQTSLVWPESGTKALRYMMKEEYIERINYDYMLAHFLSRHINYFFSLFFAFSKNKRKFMSYYLKFNLLKILVKIKFLVSFLFFWDRRSIYSKKFDENLEDIVFAERKLFEKTGEINYDTLKKCQ